MIRANFHLDPLALTPEQWAERFTEAVWLENSRLVNLAKILAKLFETTNE